MQSILSKTGRQALRSSLGKRALLVFDLDGTLAPIVPREADVAVRKTTIALLKKLEAFVPVIVLTGREAVNAQSILGWEPTMLVGNHGCEGLPGATKELPRIARDCSILIDRVAELAAKHCPPRSWRIEDKRYTFTFHCTSAPKRAAFVRLLQRQSKALRCTVIPAKRSCNVLPVSAHTKGEAIGILLQHCKAGAAIFVGDDETDETVFALRDRRVLGLHIGSRASKAQFSLRRQRSIDTLLAVLLRECEKLAA